MRRAMIACRTSVITPDDLPNEVVANSERRTDARRAGFFQLKEQRINAFEREFLTNLLLRFHGDISAASGEAQIPRGTLYRLMLKYKLKAPDFRE